MSYPAVLAEAVHLTDGLMRSRFNCSPRSLQDAHRFTLLLSVCVLVAATGSARALQNEEHPSQRQWTYRDHADVVTGEPYPALLLMTQTPAAGSSSMKGIGHGYLAVENYSKRPMEVSLAWDEPSTSQRTVLCKSSGCEVAVRFGKAAAQRFVAVQDKHSLTLILQDGRAFVSAAREHVGPIEVQVQTRTHGLVTLQFSTASRLPAERLSGRKN